MLGYDPIRLQERLEEAPDAAGSGVTIYGRPTDASSERIVAYMRERGIPAAFVDIRGQPLSKEDLVGMLTLPGSGNRAALHGH